VTGVQTCALPICWNAGNVLNVTSVFKCTSDSQCGVNQVCNSSGDCVAKPPTCVYYETCQGFNKYVQGTDCAWTTHLPKIGDCGVECLTGQDKCTGTNYFNCYNYKWNSLGEVDGKCGFVAGPTNPPIENPIGNIFSNFLNNIWLIIKGLFGWF